MTALKYPTYDDFVEKLQQAQDGPETNTDGMGAMETMVLLLLVRWQLEDENDPAQGKKLDEVTADLAVVTGLATDYEKGLVLAHLIEWCNNGEGWLADYINRIVKSNDSSDLA